MRIILNGKLPSPANEAKSIDAKGLLGETGNTVKKKSKAILTKAALSNRANTVSVPKLIAP